MKLLQYALAVGLVVGLAGCGSPTTKKPASDPKPPPAPTTTKDTPAPTSAYKDNIVGTWEVEKAESGMPKGTTITCKKDGTFKITMLDEKGKKMEMPGTYEIDGDKLMIKMKGPDGKEKKETMTIVKLTETELKTKDDKGKIDELTKK